MKLIKHILCFALAVLMLLSAVACGGGGGNTNTGDDDDDVTTVTENRVDDLPEIDMKGKEIVLRSIVQECNKNSYDVDADSINDLSDVVSEAVYQRNANLQNRLKCVFTVNESVTSGNTDDMIQEVSAMADAPVYHLVTTSTHKLIRLAVEGLLIDLASQEFVDLEKDYYDDGYNEALNAGGRQYLVSGKLTLSWYRYQIITLFNRNLFKANNMNTFFEDGSYYPYETVLSGCEAKGGWTTSMMMEVARVFEKDLDGGGLDKDDQYGYVVTAGGSSQTDGFMGAFNLRLIEKDANGYYKMLDVVRNDWNRAIGNYLDVLGGVGVYHATVDEMDDVAVENKFAKQEAAMITFRMYTVESQQMVELSRNRDGYGIIPLPKADENQYDYISYVQDQVNTFGIPRGWQGEDRVHATQFLEAFASESYNVTMPAYYELALTKKYVADVPSRRMIEIIDSNIVVDPVNVYYGAYFNLHTGKLRDVYSGKKQIVEVLTGVLDNGSFQQKIDDLNTALQALDEELKGIGE